MAVSLKKGQGVSLKKTENDLSMVTIGLGWDVKAQPAKTGFLGSLFGRGKKDEGEYDLDVAAFLCDRNGKVKNLGDRSSLKGGDVVFFNHQKHKSGALWLTGDNRTGAGDGDDEQIIARLNDMPVNYEKIVFVVQIYQGKAKNQSFSDVENAFIRAVDAKGKEMVKFELSDGAGQVDRRSMLFAELHRENDGWKFNAVGEYMAPDSFVEALKRYM